LVLGYESVIPVINEFVFGVAVAAFAVRAGKGALSLAAAGKSVTQVAETKIEARKSCSSPRLVCFVSGSAARCKTLTLNLLTWDCDNFADKEGFDH
jgi:hypothetical protein